MEKRGTPPNPWQEKTLLHLFVKLPSPSAGERARVRV